MFLLVFLVLPIALLSVLLRARLRRHHFLMLADHFQPKEATP